MIMLICKLEPQETEEDSKEYLKDQGVKESVVTNGCIHLQTARVDGHVKENLQNSESAEEPSQDSVSVNPVYQLSLRTEIGETFGSKTTSPDKSEQKSEEGGENLESPQSSPVEGKIHQATAVFVQTQSFLSRGEVNIFKREKEVDVNAQNTEIGCNTETREVITVAASCALQTAETATNKSTEEIPHSQQTADRKSCTAIPDQLTQACPNTTMATQAAQPSGEIILPQMGPVANDNASTPPGDASPALNKVPESTSTPAEDRLSSSESPEPTEEADEALAGSAKASSSPRSASNGASAEAGAAGVRADPDGKGATVKTKKKEDKSIEYILRALSSLNSPEEKLAALCKKYADLHEEHRVLQTSFKQQQRKMTVVQREKDQLQAEHTKAVIAKSKLESLCRELQKQNKVVKEESLLRVKQEEERRKEISAKFQSTITEIQAQMTDNHEKNVKLREENQDMAGKLKKFLEQYELREQQLEKLVKHRELEQQLYEAKLQQAAAVLKEEQERNGREKELILLQAAEGEKKNAVLETQLAMYKDRYEEFQGTITKSNDMFQKLKSEMDKMGKRIKKLEKEGAQWRAKWENSNKALLDMAEEKTRTDKEKQMLQTKIGKLESLCRALQGELHGKKAASPQPPSPGGSPRGDVPSACKENTISTAMTTPPNTPEENTSRASPGPDAAPSLPQQLPTGQNGPINLSDSAAVPDPSTEASQESVAPVDEVSLGKEENQVSASREDGERVSTEADPASEGDHGDPPPCTTDPTTTPGHDNEAV